MQKRDYLIILYDYYGKLIKEDKRKYFEDYYFDNLSLGEISHNYNLSRNAIFKHIKTIEEKILFYEEILKLYEKENRIKKILENNNKNYKEEILNILNN